MFRIFIFTLFTIISVAVSGQDTLNITDLNGHKQGFWCKKDSVGHIIYEGRFKNGYPAGEFRYFYPDGKLKTVSILSNLGKKAVTVSYFANGKKMAAGNYINEKKDSTWQFFSEFSGVLVSEEHYKAGVIDGISRIYYPEGGVSEIHNYKNGILDGLWEQYFTDGKIKLRCTYIAGEKQGPFKAFYDSEQLMFTGQYITGHREGIWTYYNEKGGITKKEIYSKGILLKTEEPAK
jgi:uncharacterized protein